MTAPPAMADEAAALAASACAASLLLIDPAGLGGIRLHGPADPARDAFLAAMRTSLPPSRPWLRVPASITLDRLVGGLDLTATLAAGRMVAERGVLASAHGGMVVLASAERLPAMAIGPLVYAMDERRVVVERDGIHADVPAAFAVLALDESEGDEHGLDAAIADRLAFTLRLPRGWAAEGVPLPAAGELAHARERLAHVTMEDALLRTLLAAADAFGVASPRAVLFAARAARASAALDGATAVGEDDVRRAIELVLLPRATRLPAPAEAPPPPPPPPEASDRTDDDTRDQQQEDRELAERVIAAAAAALPPELLASLDGGRVRSARAGSGRSVARTKASQHGRTVGNEAGTPRGGRRLDLLATLRTAAPWQRIRAAEAGDAPAARGTRSRLRVRPGDLRVRRIAQRVGTTVLVAVDASGSSAVQRLGEAKGAVELLLAESYVRRDRVALISFRGTAAELVLPPTRSLARAKRALAGLPGGGGTPLASALAALAELGVKVLREGGRPLAVLLTDGRANVARDGSGGRPRAEEDAKQAARAFAGAGVPMLVVDTSPRPNAALQALARVADAEYLPLPTLRADVLRDAVRGASDRRGTAA